MIIIRLLIDLLRKTLTFALCPSNSFLLLSRKKRPQYSVVWWGILECKLEYNYKTMNDEQDEFFVQPEIQEVHDIKLIESPNEITEKVVEQSKVIPLKRLQIPKEPQNYTYRPFKFEHQESSEGQNEEAPQMDETQSPFLDCYNRQQCIYQKHHNQPYNKVNDTTYFSGAFLHRNIFLEGNYSESCELDDVVKSYYQVSKEPLPCGEEDDIRFDSHFQSGNLFAAFKLGPYQYDLVMSNDVNSIGNNQWFYFSVDKLIPDRDYTFSVVNFTKSDSLFNYGMAPAVYSMAENKSIFGVEKGWRRQGRDVSYKKGVIPRQNSRRMYYKLSFKLRTVYQNDKLYIAHSYPYTNQKLARYMNDLVLKNKQSVTRITIGKTLSKRTIEGLKISQQTTKKKDTRKAILIMARQHPGETQGSYVCQGVIDRFLNKSKQSDFLLKNFVIYVVPMVNPDGVAFGHYRTNLSGKDLNRKWNATEKDLNCPQVGCIKAFIQEITKQRQIRFILDLHGHSKKFNSFFYGNPCPQNPDAVRIFPYVCSKLHPGVQYLDCTFSAQQYKRKAARVYLSYLYRLIHVYTFESSFYAYFKEGKKIQFTPKEYRQLGGILINALSLQFDHEVRFQQSTQFNTKKNNTKEFLTSPFVKMLMELKNNQQLLEQGCQNQSGSQSKPEQMEINIEQIQGFKHARPSSTPNAQQNSHTSSKTVSISRRGRRDPKQYNFNKPIRNIKFLQISRVNSVLPDKYQLGLQPIKKKQVVTEVIKPFQGVKPSTETQTLPKNELKLVSFRPAQIEACLLSNSIKFDMLQQRKYSSLIRSNNRNIIFKFDMFGQTTARQQDYLQKPSLRLQHAYTQTMITYSKQQGEKIKSSQVISSAETPQRNERRWARNNSIRVESTVKNTRRDSDLYFNGIVKKLLTEKEALKNEQYSNKFILQKPLNIVKKEFSKKG